MTLIKSKINFLAWLKSAIYISVVGGVVLSSKPGSAISFTFSETATLGTFSLTALGFENPEPVLKYSIEGIYWRGVVDVSENRGSINDVLLLSGLFWHRQGPHPEDNPTDREFTFNFVLDADDATGNQISYGKTESLVHSANHSDLFEAKLSANISDTAGFNRITNWNFTLSGEHKTEPVPEPTTIFGSALALSLGGWLKRKKSNQHNKTTP